MNILAIVNLPFIMNLTNNYKKSFEHYDEGPQVFNSAAVTTEVPICSELAKDILKQKGNAMDAAIAAAVCVGITNSFSSGIGGGGFMLVRIPGQKEILDMLDFREIAPKNFSIEKCTGELNKTKIGGMAVAVPGEIRGMFAAHQKYGSLPWSALFESNIKLARRFEASAQLVAKLNKLKGHILADEGLSEIYARNGKLVKTGDILSRENYAQTLEAIARDPEVFYTGYIADEIIKSVKKRGGVMEKEDLRDYQVKSRDVIQGSYKDYSVYTTNLPTSGVFVLQALKVFEKFDIPALKKKGLTEGKYLHIHLLVEVFKHVLSRRGEVADPDFLPKWKMTVKEILSDLNAAIIASKIDFTRTLKPSEYGQKIKSTDDHGTTHINVVDENEMCVLFTSTINLEFGAKFMNKRTGIIFNNQIDDFWVPDVQNAFDLAIMPANLAQAGKRPFSSAAPILLVKNSEIIAVGAAGGTRIPTSIIEVLLHIFSGMSLKEAIEAPRLHNQLDPINTYAEYSIPPELEAYLNSLGHIVTKSLQNTIFTSVQGITVRKDMQGDKTIYAVSDPRKGGQASGY